MVEAEISLRLLDHDLVALPAIERAVVSVLRKYGLLPAPPTQPPRVKLVKSDVER
jgi:hypothetical protein